MQATYSMAISHPACTRSSSRAPVRRYLPHLIDLVLNGAIDPGKVFDLTLPLDQVAEGYRAMDERRAIKTLLRPLLAGAKAGALGRS